MNFFSRLGQLLSDPIFWMTTILCGLVLGVVANFLTRVADKLITRVSDRRRRRLQTADDSIHKEAERLMKYPAERFDVKLDILFYAARETVWYVVAIGGLATCIVPTITLKVLPILSIVAFAILTAMVIGVLVLAQRQRNKVTRRLDILAAYEELKEINQGES